MVEINKKYIGENFDDFLNEQGVLSDVTSLSHKQILAIQISEAMVRLKMTKVEMAKKMQTSRSAVNRLLNPDNPNVTLDTLDRAASALDMDLVIALYRSN